MGHTQKRPVARGVAKRPGYRRIVIELDDDTFGKLRERAIAADTSFAEQVRTVLEWGLDSAHEYEVTEEETAHDCLTGET